MEEEGKEYCVKATVKEHELYRGIKQTVVTRVNVVKDLQKVIDRETAKGEEVFGPDARRGIRKAALDEAEAEGARQGGGENMRKWLNMKVWSIIFGLIIFVCVVTVSFSHTVDLYERVGFKWWEAISITIAVETTFLLSGWSILWYRFRGQSPGGPAYAGFVYGVAIVLFSNSAYTVGLDILFENKVAQWALALSVVAGVLIAEAIISRNLVRLREQENEQTAKQTDEQTEGQTNKTNSNEQTNSAKQSEQTNTEKEQTVKQTNNQTNESNKQDKREQTTPDKQTNRQTNEQSGKQTDKQTASTTYGKHANKQTNKQRSKQTQTDNAKVYDEAIRYRKEKGTLPSVRTLASLAGCSNHRAYKVLQELREKAG